MRRSRFSEEQIIGVSREHEAGMKPSDLCRKHRIERAFGAVRGVPSRRGRRSNGVATGLRPCRHLTFSSVIMPVAMW